MKYEIMFIVRPNLEGGALKDIVKSFEKVLTSHKGKILNSREMGQRTLAYDIEKYHNGYYYVYQVEANVKTINEFDRLAGLSEDIIRHLIIKLED